MSNKIIVGSEEWCALPNLGIKAVKARVDSGAKTSAIHAINILTSKREDGTWVSYEVHPLQGSRKVALLCESKLIDRRVIKSSNGETEKRYVVRELLQLGEQSWEIELTLTNRANMGYRMLLGREAMGDKILVDPSTTCCLGEMTDEDAKALYGQV